MHRFANILFSPLRENDNPAALRRIVDVADANNAALSLLGTVPEPSAHARLLHGKQWSDEIVETERDHAKNRLRRLVKHSDGLPIDVVAGSPERSIVERVVANDHDLVVVTTDDDHEDHVTIRRLLRECPCPVWVLRPSRARVQRVLAAVSIEPGEEDLNRAVLRLAAALYHSGGGELHVVHSWELYGESSLRSSAFIRTRTEDVDALVAAELRSHRTSIDAMVTAIPDADLVWNVHLRKGSASKVIPELVAAKRINHLVVGSMARTGLSGLVIGNTAERTVNEVSCSVVVTKPPGFDHTAH